MESSYERRPSYSLYISYRFILLLVLFTTNIRSIPTKEHNTIVWVLKVRMYGIQLIY